MTPAQEKRKFISVLADGLFHLEANEATPGAVLRKFKTTEGVEGSKWELLFSDVAGIITNIEFKEGKFGNQLLVTVKDGDEDAVVLALGTASNFGEDVMKKLPSLNLAERVIFTPYAFEDEKGKTKKGVSIKQNDVKIQNFFYDPEAKKNLHDFPEPKKKITKANPEGTLSKDAWKMYFGTCREFLTEYIEENIIPKFAPKDRLDEITADEIDME